MISSGKTRIQVTLSNSVIKAIDNYCDTVGISRSAWCASVIADEVMKNPEISKAVKRTTKK